MNIYIPLLSVSIFISLILFIYLFKNRKKSNDQINIIFSIDVLLIILLAISDLCQILFADRFNINPIKFEYFTYISGCFLPVTVYFTGLIYSQTKIKIKRIHLLLFIIPIISLIMLWTNDFHHLFYEHYSTDYNINVYGKYFIIHTVYSYLLLFLGMFYILKFSIKNSGAFSKQSMLIVLGTSIPIISNVLGTLQIIPMSIYLTPITFTLTILLFTISIFKFKFLSVSPIALQKIVDRISDSYIVLGENNSITDYNHTFLTTFKLKSKTNIRGKQLEDFLKETHLYLDFKKIKAAIPKTKTSDKTISFELYVKEIKKYFNVEINSISSKGQFLGTLILFKDITQHKLDIQTIKDTQESLMESERLSSLGQLIGGIAHNLKTPIMSIAGAAEGLTDLIKEYDESIDDPTVNSQDHHEIAQDMSKWIVKIREYTEYMSDIITAVKGQAVVMANEEDITFTISELVKRVNILMKHELKNAIITLNVNVKVDENLTVNGDVNNLVQVINNMISNAIQAYNGKPEECIEFVIDVVNNNIVFSIEDHAGGLPEKVQNKLFKEMITTKGKNGTGLGLYMSYSTIKAHFNGNITYDTEIGKGTRFNIIIPMK